jgi:hypothetical protein
MYYEYTNTSVSTISVANVFYLHSQDRERRKTSGQKTKRSEAKDCLFYSNMVHKIICLVPAPTAHGSDRKIAASSPQVYECNVPSVVIFFFAANMYPRMLHSSTGILWLRIIFAGAGFRKLLWQKKKKKSFRRSKGWYPSSDGRAKSSLTQKPSG